MLVEIFEERSGDSRLPSWVLIWRGAGGWEGVVADCSRLLSMETVKGRVVKAPDTTPPSTRDSGCVSSRVEVAYKVL